ncbi:MAG TPA: TonB-dependent receptor [Rhizomicrobium sp.]|nr:TonB-dependent receptor [Rhizomicrobium sp.]
MNRGIFKSLLAGAACAALFAASAHAQNFNIPGGDLKSALESYMKQSGIALMYPEDEVTGVHTKGVTGSLSSDEALSRLLKGTGLTTQRGPSGAIGIVQGATQSNLVEPLQLAQATPPARAVETVTVTSSKLGGADVQSIPIAITALSQEQLTSTQTAGGPDLVKQVPNLTFTKTNFTGYSIQIRGIGTQAISVTTDPAVAVALNDIPFIRNHFFEQEFFDLSQAEVLRGPQGTLYGRNATAGVVNLITAKPTDQFEAMASADFGNYKNRRFEGMINIPIFDDRVDLRVAGEWTKRDGYTTNSLTGNPVDGRDLWSSRVSLSWKPLPNLQAYFVWEHFQENDDRMRTQKQLCKTDSGVPSVTVNGVTVPIQSDMTITYGVNEAFSLTQAKFSQGCSPTSMYSPDAFEVPNGYSLPYVVAGYVSGAMKAGVDPYQSTIQSSDLRVIETQIDPRYKARNDTLEMNADYQISPSLTVSSQTGYNGDHLWSTEDYNRFNTTAGIFQPANSAYLRGQTLVSPYSNCGLDFSYVAGSPPTTNPLPKDSTYYFGDPQLGCSNRLVAQDVSREHAWQISQEVRLASHFQGPINFSLGGNYLHYETLEDYYVFANSLTMFAATSGSSHSPAWIPGVSDNHECLVWLEAGFLGHQYNDPSLGAGQPTTSCYAIDPGSLNQVDDAGHNYFLNRNPYVLNSYAGFGEIYYSLRTDLKLIGGLRWTDDQKHFVNIPSELLAEGRGYASTGYLDQSWQKFTGRFAVNWTPELDFTDQTLIYGSYAHGYKAGGANPPGPVLGGYQGNFSGVPVHPLTFEPEFVDAYEVGTKNTLLDGALTLNGDVFYYNYKNYQISEIVDRTAINLNYNATVKGAEIEASYEPLPGLRFKFAGGYEATRIGDGQRAVDLMDRTAGHAGWLVMKPFVTEPSNCVLPDYVVQALVVAYAEYGEGNPGVSACASAYTFNEDPVTLQKYSDGTYPMTVSKAGYPTINYPGFDPIGPTAVNNGYGPAPNGGNGFAKDLAGNQLPNAPHFTTSLSAEYTVPISSDWAATLHSDFYWQSGSFARVFNDKPFDEIHGYKNVNLALVLTSQNGWQAMGYLKNVFNTTAITGTFLNSDDSGLTTNIFLTDPRLFGIRITKNW